MLAGPNSTLTMQFMAKRSWTGQSQGESQVNMLRQEARAKKPHRTQGILSCAKVSSQVKLMGQIMSKHPAFP